GLESWIRGLVPDLGRETHRWSGQVLEPIDYSGFIGRNPSSKNVYVATGDSGQGMTHGALAGVLIADLITLGNSPWQELYEPSRIPVVAPPISSPRTRPRSRISPNMSLPASSPPWRSCSPAMAPSSARASRRLPPTAARTAPSIAFPPPAPTWAATSTG